jgi:aspartate aminotransferase
MGVVASKNQAFVDASMRFTQGIPFAAYIEQEIVTDMLHQSNEYVSWLSQEYQKRRDAFLDTFETEMGEKLPRPEGAFYAMLQLPIDNATTFAKWLLTDFSNNNETVMVSPGEGFYATPGKGVTEIRIAYVLEEKALAKSAQLLAKAIQIYNNKKQ